MNLSTQGAAFIRHHEGFVSRYYLDPVRVPTIGIGFTWRSDSFREWWGKNKPGQTFGPGATMTRAEADDALKFLVSKEYGAAVSRFLGKTVPQHVYDGMVSPVFNLGAGSLEWRWATAAKSGDYARAGELLKTTGTTARGQRLPGLVTRRLDEAELISLGDYTIGRPTKAPAVDPMADGMLTRGERGEAVEALQRDLKALGLYGDGVVDSIFGYGTEAAVMAAQRSFGLKADGYAGPLTLAAIEKAVAAGQAAQVPAEPEQPVTVTPPRTPAIVLREIRERTDELTILMGE